MRIIALFTGLFAAASLTATAATENAEGWRLEPGVDPPSYAVAIPQATNLNVDSVVLACEPAGNGRVLQLQLYLTDDGPLLPLLLPEGARLNALKPQARVEIAIDDRSFASGILFAEDHVVLADAEQDMIPALSAGLIDAMARGRTMALHFDLIAEGPGQPDSFDGEVVIDLQAGIGGRAVAAVRRCATPTNDPPNVARAPTH